MKTLSPKSAHPIFKLIEQCKNIATLKQVHAQMITTGLILHTYPLSRILISSSTLAATNSYALTIFNQVSNPTIFLFNTLISSSLARKDDQLHFSLALYSRILTQTTLKPNNYTYPSLFKACSSQPWLQHGRALHTHVLKFLEPPYDHFVQASLLNFYSMSGELGVARFLFDQITRPDLVSWNSILTAYAHNTSVQSEASFDNAYDSTNLSLDVLLLFNQMQKSLTSPNEVSLVALISACADLGALSQGIWAHSFVLRNGLKLNRFVGTALVAMYANCGRLDIARQLFDQLLERDTYCYNAMIRGLAVHGLGLEALDLFEKMELEGLVPDDVTMLVIICACSHVGLVDQGCEFFESMKEDYGIEPKLEHYGTLVDLLGRAGRVKEAEEIVQTIPMKPNAVLWRSLLGAARVHGNLEVGKSALKQLIQLEPETSGNYVLLSNMYASLNKWDDVKNVRKLMKDHGIDKAPGSSIVDIDGAMHEFLIGDKTHPHAKRIYLKLDEMNRRLQEQGHKSGTREALFDIEEEEKEDALSYHSESLLIGNVYRDGATKKVFSPNYTLPPARRNPDVMAIDIRQAWGPGMDVRNPHFLAFAASERQFLQSEYDDYAIASSGSLACFRYVAIILMLLLLIRQTLMVTRDFSMVQDSSTFFNFQISLLQLVAFLLPCYVMARTWYMIQCRRRQG